MDNFFKYIVFAAVILASSVADAAQQMYYIHSDHLNTPQVLTDSNQQVVWRVEQQTPFGEVEVDEDPDGDGEDVVFNLRFPGQYFDEETNTNYNYYRTYDPSLGRYIQSDPIGLDDGVNTYGYVHGNPINYADPTGEAAAAAAACFIPGVGWVSCAAAGIAAAAAAAVVGICYLTGICSSGENDAIEESNAAMCPTGTAPTTSSGKWSCSASCNVQVIDPALDGVAPGRVTGSARGKTQPAACAEAKRVATQSAPRGTYARHCQCSCSKS